MKTAVEHAAVRRSGRTRARAPPAPAGGVALTCMFVSMCVCACVYVFGPVVTSLRGVGRAPGAPSYLVGLARC